MQTSSLNISAKLLLLLLAFMVPAQPAMASGCWCGASIRQAADTKTTQVESISTKRSGPAVSHRGCSHGCCHRSQSQDRQASADSKPYGRKPYGCPAGCVCQAKPMPLCLQKAVDFRPTTEGCIAWIAPPMLLMPTDIGERLVGCSKQNTKFNSSLHRCSELCRFLV